MFKLNKKLNLLFKILGIKIIKFLVVIKKIENKMCSWY
jgi:hypothetical protein